MTSPVPSTSASEAGFCLSKACVCVPHTFRSVARDMRKEHLQLEKDRGLLFECLAAADGGGFLFFFLCGYGCRNHPRSKSTKVRFSHDSPLITHQSWRHYRLPFFSPSLRCAAKKKPSVIQLVPGGWEDGTEKDGAKMVLLWVRFQERRAACLCGRLVALCDPSLAVRRDERRKRGAGATRDGRVEGCLLACTSCSCARGIREFWQDN